MNMKDIILASKSPRRIELFKKLNLPFSCITPDIDEAMDLSCGLENAVAKLAFRKANSIIEKHHNTIVIGADTIVTLENFILGKPRDKQDAFNMLMQLSGKTHKVMTGVCILTDNRMESFCDTSEVTFYHLTDNEIKKYIATGEPMDKAGAYGIQGQGALLVKHLNGDFYSIMGLPIARINQILHSFITG